MQLSNGSLFAPRAEPGHAGTYVCRAANNVSRIDKTIKIVVKCKCFYKSLVYCLLDNSKNYSSKPNVKSLLGAGDSRSTCNRKLVFFLETLKECEWWDVAAQNSKSWGGGVAVEKVIPSSFKIKNTQNFVRHEWYSQTLT